LELTSGLAIGSVLLQTAIGAISGAILTVFASLFMHPIDTKIRIRRDPKV
jgi:hypothetical protein